MLSKVTSLLGLTPSPRTPDTQKGDDPKFDFASVFARAEDEPPSRNLDPDPTADVEDLGAADDLEPVLLAKTDDEAVPAQLDELNHAVPSPVEDVEWYPRPAKGRVQNEISELPVFGPAKNAEESVWTENASAPVRREESIHWTPEAKRAAVPEFQGDVDLPTAKVGSPFYTPAQVLDEVAVQNVSDPHAAARSNFTGSDRKDSVQDTKATALAAKSDAPLALGASEPVSSERKIERPNSPRRVVQKVLATPINSDREVVVAGSGARQSAHESGPQELPVFRLDQSTAGLVPGRIVRQFAEAPTTSRIGSGKLERVSSPKADTPPLVGAGATDVAAKPLVEETTPRTSTLSPNAGSSAMNLEMSPHAESAASRIVSGPKVGLVASGRTTESVQQPEMPIDLQVPKKTSSEPISARGTETAVQAAPDKELIVPLGVRLTPFSSRVGEAAALEPAQIKGSPAPILHEDLIVLQGSQDFERPLARISVPGDSDASARSDAIFGNKTFAVSNPPAISRPIDRIHVSLAAPPENHVPSGRGEAPRLGTDGSASDAITLTKARVPKAMTEKGGGLSANSVATPEVDAPAVGRGSVTSPLLADVFDDPLLSGVPAIGAGTETRAAAIPVAAGTAYRSEAIATLRQVAEGMARLSEGTIDIRLSPDELGHVRMQLVASETGMTVHVSADRPETLDLLRRHIDQLERDLADAGYESASFSFSDGKNDGNRERGDGKPLTDRDRAVAGAETPQPTSSPVAMTRTDRLDLRF